MYIRHQLLWKLIPKVCRVDNAKHACLYQLKLTQELKEKKVKKIKHKMKFCSVMKLDAVLLFDFFLLFFFFLFYLSIMIICSFCFWIFFGFCFYCCVKRMSFFGIDLLICMLFWSFLFVLMQCMSNKTTFLDDFLCLSCNMQQLFLFRLINIVVLFFSYHFYFLCFFFFLVCLFVHCLFIIFLFARCFGQKFYFGFRCVRKSFFVCFWFILLILNEYTMYVRWLWYFSFSDSIINYLSFGNFVLLFVFVICYWCERCSFCFYLYLVYCFGFVWCIFTFSFF